MNEKTRRFLVRFRLILILVVLATASVTGLLDALNTMRVMDTPLEMLAVSTQIAYVVLGVLAVCALLAKHRALRWLLIGWAISTAATAALATYVWGEADLGAMLASGFGAAGLGALIVWGGVASARD